LANLKALGINLALDDFGSGFSSINYLTFIPVYKIKLDKSLCDRFLEKENEDVIINLISLVHSLGLVITAEGIEKMEQYLSLKNSGCDYIQGYLFSRPIKMEEVEDIYRKKNLKLIDL
jgi:EAL domain-containing protein (putative c-di-GMP-specific phosphodiesterase class I)